MTDLTSFSIYLPLCMAPNSGHITISLTRNYCHLPSSPTGSVRGSFKFKLDWSTAAGPICLNPDRPPCLSLSLPNDFCPARNVTETMKDGISAASAREANCLPPARPADRALHWWRWWLRGKTPSQAIWPPSLRPSFFAQNPSRFSI